MKLSTKIALAVFSAMMIMLAVTYFISVSIIKSSYVRLENEQAADNIAKTQSALNVLIANNDTFTKSWSNWDELYQYAKDKNQKFVDINLQPSAFSLYYLDMVLVYDTNGNPVFVHEFNNDKTQFLPLSNEIARLFQPGGTLRKLVTLPEDEHDVAGLILIPSKGVLAFASRRILPSSGSGVANGTLIFAQYLHGDVWDTLKKNTKLDMMIYPLSFIKQNIKLDALYKKLLKTDTYYISSHGNSVYLFKLLKDINNNPIAIIKIIQPLDIYQISAASIHYFKQIFLIPAILISILIYMLFYFLLIHRISRLNKYIDNPNDQNNYPLTKSYFNKDEISSIGHELNNLVKMAISTENLLSHVINSLSSSLIITDKNLKIIIINSSAKKELNKQDNDIIGKPLFTLYPYLKEYENKLFSVLEHNIAREIDKVANITSDNTCYYNLVIYPLTRNNEVYLAIRIVEQTELVKAQKRLIENDKLASIGILTAGVAHEINNPINFVANAINPLKSNIEDIFILLNKYNEIQSGADITQKLTEIEEFKNEININICMTESAKLIGGIKDGANRTSTIVRDLKLFSKPDEEFKPANINHGIDSTLTLLTHNYKDRIQINKQYDQSLPQIICVIGKINQVFMNIIGNAIDAIPEKGEITIKTEQSGDNVLISIKDNGPGMNEETIKKIFTPFFTTKEAGKGTGIGLAICASIIQDHEGTITVNSKMGEGTEFVISLPIYHTETPQ